jgi:hypothetical protein
VRELRAAKGAFESYLWDSFKYYCWRHAKRERARRLGHLPVETVNQDGYVDIRIAEPSDAGTSILPTRRASASHRAASFEPVRSSMPNPATGGSVERRCSCTK